MEAAEYDVIVVGAGAAGLIAAWEIGMTGRKVVLLEARERIGGRVHTVSDPLFDLPVERGAEFIHGNLPLSQLLLQKAGISYYPVEGSVWRHTSGIIEEQDDFIENFPLLEKKFALLEEDMPVSVFLDRYLSGEEYKTLRFTLASYVEGYNAADTGRASSFSLREEMLKSDDEQFRIEGGYGGLIGFLESQCRSHGVDFFLSHPVTVISWKQNEVEVICRSQQFTASRILITVPVGVLQTGALRFEPGIPEKMEAAGRLGFGGVIKLLLSFDKPFWTDPQLAQGKNLSDMGFLFTKTAVPTWWTYYPKRSSLLTGWLGGPNAERLKDLEDEALLSLALDSLCGIFELKRRQLEQQLKAWHIANWINDPFTCGGYSYDVVDGTSMKQLIKTPEKDTLFFAGEGLFEGPELGTVNAALVNGRDMARKLIASFKS
ncbi:MAG TPA: NAD(P)/FAD-dependent oxidoreductase [Flavisolibacter sp.]|nr:NAD(P)/FAD-dependent oxidoreductase [Flavisolibacter sp.]